MTARRSDHDGTLMEATDLLNVELPDRRWADESHLRWLYHENPFGDGFYGFRREGERVDAHYAVIPQDYRTPEGPMRMVFSLNAVTRSVGQRKGHFASIAEEVYARCAEEYGAQGIIGVTNANSTPPVVKRLDFRLMGPLPVRVMPGFGRAAVGVDHQRATGEHRSDDLVAVSVPSHYGPVRAAVIVKLCPRVDPHGERVDSGPIIAAICRYHRAQMAVYAGFNARVRVRGVQPPRRLQPAPLNLIYRSVTDRAPKEGFRLETFEFLDMDAY
jgi:hypothetical protein